MSEPWDIRGADSFRGPPGLSKPALTLPARHYTSPEIFHAEMERLYFRSWICAGRAERIPKPGDYFLRNFAGESLIVTRDNDGRIRTFFNVCRHRGTRICSAPEGAFAGRIACPYHGWTYGLDGSLLGAPHMEQAGFSRADYPLHAVAADVWDGHIFIHCGPDRQPLATQISRLREKFAAWRMEELRLARSITYDVKANWKLIVSNYNECLHCPFIHPALHRLTDYMGADNEAPAPGYIGGTMGFRDGAETMTADGIRRRDYLLGLDATQRRMVCYYAILPNFLLSLHPDYMMTHTLWPQSVDRTEVMCEWHFHPREMAKADFQADDAIEFWDLTNRQDWSIVEMSQAGIQSRAYSPGPYSQREELLRAFDAGVIASLEE
jgi:phenylpropionate dioxygenase-like ring-hydroxylating dioxygenase large terminal subunit